MELLAHPKPGVGGASMFQFLRGVAIIAAVMTNCGFAFAEDLQSANYMMAGCRASLRDPMPPNSYYLAGVCVGAVEGIWFAGVGMCIPKGATVSQAIRVAVKYIDDRPARLNENFKALILEALRAAWPCKN
jgi:Rap1a immunity proteins